MVDVPPGEATVTSTTPALAAAGLTTLMDVEETIETLGA